MNFTAKTIVMWLQSLKAIWSCRRNFTIYLEKGIEKGKLEEAIIIARERKKEGLAIEFIAKTTRLSIEEIGKL